MSALNRETNRLLFRTALACVSVTAIVAGAFWIGASLAARSGARSGAPGMPYMNMPAIAPFGVRVDRYVDVPEFAKGPSVDPAKGYRTQQLGDRVYMITDGAYQSMFMTLEDGVIVVDAPPSYASHIPEAIAEITDKPITHLVYSHAHTDHIGGATSLGAKPIIVAHAETNRLLARTTIPIVHLPPRRLTPNTDCRSALKCWSLSYHGNAHVPGNIFTRARRWWTSTRRYPPCCRGDGTRSSRGCNA